MAKVILTSGDEAFVAPAIARKMVAAGEATYCQATPEYSTRRMVAESPSKPKPKAKRKRRSKAEIEADEAAEAEQTESED